MKLSHETCRAFYAYGDRKYLNTWPIHAKLHNTSVLVTIFSSWDINRLANSSENLMAAPSSTSRREKKILWLE